MPAHRIGLLLFCPDCGTLLDLPGDEDSVECEQCGHLEPASSYDNVEVVTQSHPDAFPSALKQKRTTQTKVHDVVERSKTNEKCPECGHNEAYYTEKQMRSADEGSTIHYECTNPDCRHGWKVNN